MAQQVVPFALRKLIEKVAGRDAADEIERAAEKDPEVKNDLSAEKPIQSRVVVGSSAAGIASFGIVMQQIGTYGFDLPSYDWAIFGPALAGVYASGYALYGRLKGGLKPLGMKNK